MSSWSNSVSTGRAAASSNTWSSAASSTFLLVDRLNDELVISVGDATNYCKAFTIASPNFLAAFGPLPVMIFPSISTFLPV